MSTLNLTKYIDKDPPINQDDQSVVDYLAYMKERINFLFHNMSKNIVTAINSGSTKIDPTRIGIADYVIEEGSFGSPSWYYRKWASGYAEAWYRVSHTLSFNTAWGSVYTADIPRANYPFEFRNNSQPIENVSSVGSKTGTDDACWICNAGGNTGPTHTQTGVYKAIRPVSGDATIRISYYVRGLLP